MFEIELTCLPYHKVNDVAVSKRYIDPFLNCRHKANVLEHTYVIDILRPKCIA